MVVTRGRPTDGIQFDSLNGLPSGAKRSHRRRPGPELVYGALADDPRRVGKPLRFQLEGLHSARRGDFRIIYRIGDQVTIIAIEHRADVYRPHPVKARRSPLAAL